MLYLSVGNPGRAMELWNAEKVAFPESTPYMDLWTFARGDEKVSVQALGWLVGAHRRLRRVNANDGRRYVPSTCSPSRAVFACVVISVMRSITARTSGDRPTSRCA